MEFQTMLLLIIAIAVGIVLCLQIASVMGKNKKSTSQESRSANMELRDVISGENDKLSNTLNQNISQAFHMNREITNQIAQRISDNTVTQKNALDDMKGSVNEVKLSLDNGLRRLTHDTNMQLNQMREVVDEKLNTTLEKRLNESFTIMHARLESLQKGLGEMQTLSSGVADLNKALSNTNTRGSWGEVQLESLLAQRLAPGQFRTKEPVKGGKEQVDFVIVLPMLGATDGQDKGETLLPIDAKFPIINYTRIVEAAEIGDKEAVKSARAELKRTIVALAKDISSKYINPPHTTPYAVMYLPVEAMFAEVQSIDHGAIPDQTQQLYNVTICGPSTIGALISNVQMLQRSVAIERRSGEVWQMLGMFKKEFGNYTNLLDKANTQLGTVAKTIDDASKRTRIIQKKLKGVEALDEGISQVLLQTDSDGDQGQG